MHNVKDVILLIENATSIDDINKIPDMVITTERYKKTFDSFIRNRNEERAKDIRIVYTSIEDSGETVMKLIFEFIKNNL